MQNLIDTATRKALNALFDARVSGVASVAFVVLMIILWSFELI